MENQDLFQKRYLIKPVTLEHADEVFNILKNQFNHHQPLIKAYFKLLPQRRENEISMSWDERRKFYVEEALKRGLSIGCFDLQNNQELVGVILVSDHLTKEASKKVYYLPYTIELKDKLFATVPSKYLTIINSQSSPFIEHQLFYIRQDHGGKGLLKKMVVKSDQLAIERKYRYSFCWASNFRTAKTFKRLGYTLIGQTNGKQFVLEGFYPYQLLEEEQQMQTLWLKEFSGNQES